MGWHMQPYRLLLLGNLTEVSCLWCPESWKKAMLGSWPAIMWVPIEWDISTLTLQLMIIFVLTREPSIWGKRRLMEDRKLHIYTTCHYLFDRTHDQNEQTYRLLVTSNAIVHTGIGTYSCSNHAFFVQKWCTLKTGGVPVVNYHWIPVIPVVDTTIYVTNPFPEKHLPCHASRFQVQDESCSYFDVSVRLLPDQCGDDGLMSQGLPLPFPPKDTEEELIEAFKVFDRDRDGFISGGAPRCPSSGVCGYSMLLIVSYGSIIRLHYTLNY